MTARTVSTAAAFARIQADLKAGQDLYSAAAALLSVVRGILDEPGAPDADRLDGALRGVSAQLDRALARFDDATG